MEELENEEPEKIKKVGKTNKVRKGKTFKVSGVTPHRLLKNGKYYVQKNGSYQRVIDDDRRFHAYIISVDEIEIHVDTIYMNSKGIWHKASDKGVSIEIARLKKLSTVC